MRCGSPTTSRFVMAEKIRPVEQMLELSDDEAVSAEHLDSQVQKAQEQLLQLKRQQEQIEKQKRELEELSRRQEELENGRAEMTDKLTRALVVLEREAYSVQNRLEQIRLARESFAQHLELVEAIDPRSWNPSDLHKELSRALSTVDDARTEYGEQRSRLQATGATAGEAVVWYGGQFYALFFLTQTIKVPAVPAQIMIVIATLGMGGAILGLQSDDFLKGGGR